MEIQTKPELLKCEDIKSPSPGLITQSPTLPMEAFSPITLEESKELKLTQGKDIIGDYLIGKIIGTGAYGVVKAGENRKTG